MNQPPCLCTGRSDIRCDAGHCDLAGPGAPGDADQCRVCWLRLNQPAPAPQRVLPCLFLGPVLNRLGCDCPRQWLRQCELHKVCTLEQCKQCPDYETMG
jgi:hypothetical protein